MQWLSMMIFVRNKWENWRVNQRFWWHWYDWYLKKKKRTQEKVTRKRNRMKLHSWGKQIIEIRPINPGKDLKMAKTRPGDCWPKLRTPRHGIVNVTPISGTKSVIFNWFEDVWGFPNVSQTALDDGLDKCHPMSSYSGWFPKNFPIDHRPSNGSKTTPRHSRVGKSSCCH